MVVCSWSPLSSSRLTILFVFGLSLLLLVCSTTTTTTDAFSFVARTTTTANTKSRSAVFFPKGKSGSCPPLFLANKHNPRHHNDEKNGEELEAYRDDDWLVVSSRRNWISGAVTRIGISSVPLFAGNDDCVVARAQDTDDAVTTTTAGVAQPVAAAAVQVDMKNFVDPQGLFSLRIPKPFFVLRRSAKGDLPNAKTGEGRRGSSIFTAGDMGKAEIIAVERFPAYKLLEENGIEATGDLSTFQRLGEPAAVADLLRLRRDRDKPGMTNTVIVPNSLAVSADGKDLFFRLKTEIEVQKPELLMEQYGVSELYRITSAKATLRSNDGNIMAVFASALETDYIGPDGAALQDAVNSFEVTDQSNLG